MSRRLVVLALLLAAVAGAKSVVTATAGAMKGDTYPKQVFRYVGTRELNTPFGKQQWAIFTPMRPIAFGVQAIGAAGLVRGETLICEPYPVVSKAVMADGHDANVAVIRLRCDADGARYEFEIKGPVFEK